MKAVRHVKQGLSSILQSADRLVTDLGSLWPLLIWLFVTILLSAHNEALQAVWAGWSHSRDSAFGVSVNEASAAAALFFLCLCVYIGAKSLVDARIESHPADPPPSQNVQSIALISVYALIFSLLIAGGRYRFGVSAAWLLIAFYSLLRIATLCGLWDRPRIRLSVACILITTMVACFYDAPERQVLMFTGAILILSECFIALSYEERKPILVFGTLILLALTIATYWFSSSYTLNYYAQRVVACITVLPWAIVLLYWSSKMPLRVRRLVSLALAMSVAACLFLMWDIGKRLEWSSPIVLCASLITILVFSALHRFIHRPWSRTTYFIIAGCALCLILAVSIAVSIQGRHIATPVGAVAIVLVGLGLWGLVLICGPIHYLKTGGKRRYLIAIAALIGAAHLYRASIQPKPVLEAPPETRISLADLAARKISANAAETYYVVAAAGGGLRAAIHTAAVLERLNSETCGEFDKRLLAISSVSGGSLGAAAYLNSPDRRIDPTKCRVLDVGESSDIIPGSSRPSVAKRFLSGDFLAGTAAALLFPNAVHMVFPFAFSELDRGDVLRSDWEEAWRQTGSRTRLDTGFVDALSSVDSPSFIVNTTSVTTGERVLISSTIPGTGSTAVDLLAVAPEQRSITLSNAVLNSSRFPYVTPAAKVWTLSPDQLSAWRMFHLHRNGPSVRKEVVLSRGEYIDRTFLKISPRVMDYLVDGGYFENSGAESLIEAIHEIKRILPEGARLRAIVIYNEPTSDWDLRCTAPFESQSKVSMPVPTATGEETRDLRRTRTTRPFAQSFGLEGIAEPPMAFMRAREARGKLAVERLVSDLKCDSINEAHFEEIEGFPSAPLSWYVDPDMQISLRRNIQSFIEEIRIEDPSLFRPTEDPM